MMFVAGLVVGVVVWEWLDRLDTAAARRTREDQQALERLRRRLWSAK